MIMQVWEEKEGEKEKWHEDEERGDKRKQGWRNRRWEGERRKGTVTWLNRRFRIDLFRTSLKITHPSEDQAWEPFSAEILHSSQ